jgi:hypothetical protein
MGGMRRHRLHSLQELEEVREQSLPSACRGHSPERNLTGPRKHFAVNTWRTIT